MHEVAIATANFLHEFAETKFYIKEIFFRLQLTDYKNVIVSSIEYVGDLKVNETLIMLNEIKDIPDKWYSFATQTDKKLETFSDIINGKDFKSDILPEIVKQLNQQKAELEMENMKLLEHLTSSGMKNILFKREDIDMQIELLHFYLNRYKNDKEIVREKMIEKMDLIHAMATEALKEFRAGSIGSIKAIFSVMSNRLNNFIEFLENASEDMIPKAIV